jgi:hypothetical protein
VTGRTTHEVVDLEGNWVTESGAERHTRLAVLGSVEPVAPPACGLAALVACFALTGGGRAPFETNDQPPSSLLVRNQLVCARNAGSAPPHQTPQQVV